jgi:hypothetical protein
MNKTSFIALAGGVLLSAATAGAQTVEPAMYYVSVNAGAQMQEHSLSSSITFPLYNQTAAVNTAQNIETGPFFDVSVGGRFWTDIGVAVGFSTFRNSSDLVGVAVIPHPAFFDSAATVEFTTGADHNENNIYVLALWFVPLRERLDATLSAGPSFIRVQQGVLADLTVPPGTQAGTPNVVTEEAWGTGINVGGDITYELMTRGNLRIGLGGFLRYNGASVELPSGADVDAGGFQGGGGLRFRF